MALTGTPEVALGPPQGLVESIGELGSAFAGLDALGLLGERAAIMGLWRRGTVSCGGSCHLVATADRQWLGVSLPRPDDVAAVPAWFERDGNPPTPGPELWRVVEDEVCRRDAADVLARAVLLGLPVSLLGEATDQPASIETVWGDASPGAADGCVVVDLSALWAGPLCADLLAQQGASVTKVESLIRPDGARRGPAAFFDLLNGRKRSVALDFATDEGRRALHTLVDGADVVVEASRPRALEQLGISAAEMLRCGRPQVWISITGYGRASDRIAFGDDAAVAGGLVVWHDGTPAFCADAIGDPLTGLTAARACLDALAAGGRRLIDVSMAGVCAGYAGATSPVPPGAVVAPPRARRSGAPAPAMGTDTSSVLAALTPT
jgi:hypothetical protein